LVQNELTYFDHSVRLSLPYLKQAGGVEAIGWVTSCIPEEGVQA